MFSEAKSTFRWTDKNTVFHKVAENLYRLESSGGYYALIKRGGKQFRRSLKKEIENWPSVVCRNLKRKLDACH
jgi:hypothetical protein